MTLVGEPKLEAVREAFGASLFELARLDSRIVALSADLRESLNLGKFAQELPEQYFEMGVAEQNMMGVATGLALAGKIPFVTSFATFNPGRNWDQLRVGVCYSKANVKIIGSHAGLSTGLDGATHQALEDIAITRCLPNLTVYVPTDGEELRQMLPQIIDFQGPVYIRFGREKVEIITSKESKIKIFSARVFQKGTDLTLIACGPMVQKALEAAQALSRESISVEVIANPFVKPLDQNTIFKSAQKTKLVVTIEDGQVMGGMGSAVAEYLSEYFPVPVHRLGVNDQFGQSGGAEELYAFYGINTAEIVALVRKLVRCKI